MNRQAKFCILVLIAVVTTTMMASVAKAQTPVPQVGPPVSAIKETIDIIQGVFTVMAIIVGGIWGYWLFVQNRQRYPRASIGHRITHRPIANGKLLLHVAVIISNTGNVLVSLVSLETRIQQVLPPPVEVLDFINEGHNPVPDGDTEIDWPLIDSRESTWKRGEYEIEPCESQEIHYDFVLDAEVQTVEIYSYLKNEKKRDREIGWDVTTLYDLDDIGKVSSQATRSESNGRREAARKTETAEA